MKLQRLLAPLKNKAQVIKNTFRSKEGIKTGYHTVVSNVIRDPIKYTTAAAAELAPEAATTILGATGHTTAAAIVAPTAVIPGLGYAAGTKLGAGIQNGVFAGIRQTGSVLSKVPGNPFNIPQKGLRPAAFFRKKSMDYKKAHGLLPPQTQKQQEIYKGFDLLKHR